MRTKTAYRQSNSDIPPDDIPADIPAKEINGVEAEPVAAVSSPDIPPEPTLAEPALAEPELQPDVEAIAKAEAAAAEADTAALALKRQLEALRRAEQFRHQQAEQMRLQYERVPIANQPMTRDEKIELWQTQGLSDNEAEFLREHPAMIDFPELASYAAAEAIQSGLVKNSEPYWKAVRENFDKGMSHLKAYSEAMQPTPEFFKPKAPPVKPVRGPAHFVSAPVSREVPSATPRPPDPRRVELSAEEQQIAAASGISSVEYAKHKLRLLQEKAAGTRQ